MDESLRDLTVNKNNMGFVTMDMYGESDDMGEGALKLWKDNLLDMVEWVRVRDYFNANKIGLFAYGRMAEAAICLAGEDTGLAFLMTVPSHDSAVDGQFTQIPTLFLQGTGDKIELQMGRAKPVEIQKTDDPDTRSTHILFNGSDDFLYNVNEQAAGEAVKWLRAIEII
jgi:hypothetical protein